MQNILLFADLQRLGVNGISEAEFDNNINAAIDALNDLTNDHYYFHDFEKDVPYRKEKFKKALAAQVKLYVETGSNSLYGMNEPQTVSIGRTNISRGGSTGNANNVSGYADEAIRHLRPTGLLYRGL